MRSLRTLGLLAWALASLDHSLYAEDEGPALIGQRLRVTTRTGQHSKPVVGTVVKETDRTLGIEVGEGRSVEISRDAIASLEISRARSRKGHGATVGLLIGGVAGAGLGYAIGTDSKGAPFCTFDGCATLGPFGPTRGEGAILLGLSFGAVGGGVGALVSPGERWEQVPRPSVRIGAAPVRGGLGFRLALSF